MTTNIKAATQLIKAELKKLDHIINEWHEAHKNINAKWLQENKNTLALFTKSVPTTTNMLQDFKNYHVIYLNNLENFSEDYLKINQQFSKQIKPFITALGSLTEKNLSSVNSKSYGVNASSKKQCKLNLESALKFDLESGFVLQTLNPTLTSINKQQNYDDTIDLLNKKCNKAIKPIVQKVKSEDEFLKKLAYTEFFLNNINSIPSNPLIKFMDEKLEQFITDNEILSKIYDSLRQNIAFDLLNKELDATISVDPIEIENIKNSYGKPFDQESLKHAKQGFKAVLDLLQDSASYFDSVINENPSDSLFFLHTQDMQDHLNLTKACLAHNVLDMSRYYSMDTASRDYMDDDLHSYLNSDEFFTEIKQIKKSKSKSNKP